MGQQRSPIIGRLVDVDVAVDIVRASICGWEVPLSSEIPVSVVTDVVLEIILQGTKDCMHKCVVFLLFLDCWCAVLTVSSISPDRTSCGACPCCGKLRLATVNSQVTLKSILVCCEHIVVER